MDFLSKEEIIDKLETKDQEEDKVVSFCYCSRVISKDGSTYQKVGMFKIGLMDSLVIFQSIASSVSEGLLEKQQKDIIFAALLIYNLIYNEKYDKAMIIANLFDDSEKKRIALFLDAINGNLLHPHYKENPLIKDYLNELNIEMNEKFIESLKKL